ncbi:hypothetical protein LSTR_LSTR013424 [Laodelphax striatellus]|uniref:Ig-like domain-containing protein n=1 Tax=Laodelphax striatellus TaxID=195883 RepID=A0A482XE25_LAOST|nr:hypothetical protein LSTR_LSTR013424 [Laodelphax striatellus]
MGSVLAMAKDFLQQHNKMLNELQMKSTEINALLSTLPATLETLDAESQRDCKAKAEELVRQSDSLREALERRTELARTFVKFHSLAVELASDMDALDDTLNPSTITTNALNSCKQRWLNVQQVFLQFVNTGTNFNEDSYKEPEPAREKDISTLRRIVEDKRSVWERSWTERRLELDQSQQLCQFDVDLEHIYKNIEQLEEQLISVRGQYGESLATAKATSLTFLYFEKTIELLQQRIETFVSAAEVMSKTDGNSSKHIQVEVSRLRKRWEEFEKQVSESRRLIDLSIQFFTLVEEAEDWFREGSQLLVTIARRSAVSKTPEDATEMLNELEIFFKPGESIQDDRINKIADLAEQLFVGEARPPAQVSQVREESREMKTSFQQVTKELKSLLEGYKEPEKMDVVPSEPPVTLIKEQHTTTHVTSTEKTIIEVVENGVTTVRKQKSPSPPPKKAKYQEIEAIPMPPQFSQPLADAVIWYHEERPVKESEDFQLLFHGDRCSLIIQEAYVEDSGEYKVVAINSAGEASSKCRLTVQSVGGSDVKGATRQAAVETTTREKKVEMSVCSMPKFTQLLTDVLVPVGESVTLECTVSGQPMPVVAWLHNSRTIVPSDRIKWEQSEDGHCTLHIDNVTVEDKGNYTALVQSKMGEAKCFAHLIVKGSISDQEAEAKIKHDDRPVLPSFTELFADRIVCLGEPTKFECIVAGKPKPKVRWLFNDKPVAGKDMLISTSGPRQVLSIPSVTSETAGQITCVAENEAGKAACTAKLAISDAPIDILLPTLDNIKLSETEGGVEMRRQVVSESSSSRVYSSGTTIASHGSTTEHPPTVHVQSVSSRSELASHKIGDQPAVQEKNSLLFTTKSAVTCNEADPAELEAVQCICQHLTQIHWKSSI